MGGCSIDKYGVPLTDEAVEVAKSSDAVLLGSIGGNTSTSPWYKLAPNLSPEEQSLVCSLICVLQIFILSLEKLALLRTI